MSAIGLVPICFTCARFAGLTPEIGWACVAFPDGIPVDILASRANHRKSYPGDHGLQYVRKSDLGQDQESTKRK